MANGPVVSVIVGQERITGSWGGLPVKELVISLFGTDHSEHLKGAGISPRFFRARINGQRVGNSQVIPGGAVVTLKTARYRIC